MTEHFPSAVKQIAAPFFHDAKSTPSLIDTMGVFGPIIAGINALRGEVETVNGYPAFIDHSGQWSRIDLALSGWIDCWKRMDPAIEQGPLERLAKKLSYGAPLFESDIDSAAKCINGQISRFMTLPVESILHHAMIEQISIQLEQMGIKKTVT